MSNRDDLQSMNSYVQNRSQPAAGAPASVMQRWQTYKAQWDSWFPGVMSSWYVSDGDLAHGRRLRDSMMWNQNPANWKTSPGSVASTPAKSTKKMEKGLVSPKYQSKDSIKALQLKINAAGYKPPLKLDGKWGKATAKGHEWLKAKESFQGASEQLKSEMASASMTLPTPAKPPPFVESNPTPKISADEVKRAAADPQRAIARTLLGLPINIRTVAGAAVGAAAGFAIAPIAAALGAPIGFAAAAKLLPEKEK